MVITRREMVRLSGALAAAAPLGVLAQNLSAPDYRLEIAPATLELAPGRSLRTPTRQLQHIVVVRSAPRGRVRATPERNATVAENFSRRHSSAPICAPPLVVRYRLLRNPRVAARVRALQEAAAERSLRSTAALIHDLEAIVDSDPNELVRLDVGPCRHCHGVGGQYQWKHFGEFLDAMTQATDEGASMPSDAGGFGYRMDAEANPACNTCGGAGKPRVVFNSTADVSPGARKLLRGIELLPDGTVKRVLLHDQMSARIELHRLRGLHIERTESKNLNINATLPVPADLSAEALLDLWKEARRD
jgi:hypothetical protein